MEEVTCARLALGDGSKVYARVEWRRNTFLLDATDGVQAWSTSPSSETIEDRASQWDQNLADYMRDLRSHLSQQQADSTYKFEVDDSGARLSWTLSRGTTKLESRWKLRQSFNPKETISKILDFLFDADAKIREELKQKEKTFQTMKVEAEKCLKQSKRLAEEKIKYEDEVVKKFVALLNSKKEKLRQLGGDVDPDSPSEKVTDEDEDLGDDEETDREDNDEDEMSLGSAKRKASEISSPPSVKGKEKVKPTSKGSPSSLRRRL